MIATSYSRRCARISSDLLYFRGERRYGVEFKHADSPAVNRSMRIAMADLRIGHLYIVYPGPDTYELEDRVTVLALRDLDRLTR